MKQDKQNNSDYMTIKEVILATIAFAIFFMNCYLFLLLTY
jgi:hypothetical protein